MRHSKEPKWSKRSVVSGHSFAPHRPRQWLKEKGALMLVQSSAVESMGIGGLMGAAAMKQQVLSEGQTMPQIGAPVGSASPVAL